MGEQIQGVLGDAEWTLSSMDPRCGGGGRGCKDGLRTDSQASQHVGGTASPHGQLAVGHGEGCLVTRGREQL